MSSFYNKIRYHKPKLSKKRLSRKKARVKRRYVILHTHVCSWVSTCLSAEMQQQSKTDHACLVQSHLSTAKILSLLTHCHTSCKIKYNQLLN